MSFDIAYLENADALEPDQIQGFFVGWPNPPTLETHLRLLQNSAEIVLAFDRETEQVIGFVSAITDGVLSAYIPLLEVLPAYQRRGIGGELMRRMLARLDTFYMADLLCDAPLQPFYETVGMKPATGMQRRSYERQSGIVDSQKG